MGLTIPFQALKCRIDSERQKIYLKSLNKQIKKDQVPGFEIIGREEKLELNSIFKKAQFI